MMKKKYISPTLSVRNIQAVGMLCVSMRKSASLQLNDQYQSGSSTEGGLDFAKAVHPERSYDRNMFDEEY